MSYDITKYVERRLEEWANWYLYYGDFSLGFPKENLVSKLVKYGGHIIRLTRCPDLNSNKEAEEIENYVIELTRQNKVLAKVLREQYFGLGNAHSKAERLKISYPLFRQSLDMAKQWMMGRLSSKFCRKYVY